LSALNIQNGSSDNFICGFCRFTKDARQFFRRIDDVKANAHAEPIQGTNLTSVCVVCFWIIASNDLFVGASRGEYFTRIAVLDIQDCGHFVGEGLH
jgi:hypothetical protein